MSHLQYIDHKYLRFFYHPLEDRFVLMSGWKDPLWTDVKVMRAGLDAEDRDSRELIFGKNLIEIQQKSVPQLLVDEVGVSLAGLICSSQSRLSIRFTSSKSPALSFGLWTHTITTLSASSLFLFLALGQPLPRRDQYVLPSGHSTAANLVQTMRRLREISLFECHVRVLRNGFCKSAWK